MNYFINPGALSAVFTVPCKAVDSGLKLASEAQIKVLLYVMRNLAEGIDAGNTAAALGMTESGVEDCLLYWSQAGIFGAAGKMRSRRAQKPGDKKARRSERRCAPRARTLPAEERRTRRSAF